MIPDIEAEVFDAVSSHARGLFPALETSSWPEAVPESYPFASIMQTDQYEVARTLTSDHENEFSHVTFEVNVYSADTRDRKGEAKAISRAIAERFRALGFVQTAGGQPLDLTDTQQRTVARYFSRFEAATDGTTIHNP